MQVEITLFPLTTYLEALLRIPFRITSSFTFFPSPVLLKGKARLAIRDSHRYQTLFTLSRA